MTMELVIIAALAAGFLGSSHCAGMCGPVVMLLESGASDSSWRRQLVYRGLYNLGRGLCYVTLGMLAGLSGAMVGTAVGFEAAGLLRGLALVMVVFMGLHLMGFTRFLGRLEQWGAAAWRRVTPMARALLPLNTPARALAAGIVWGALPCGLVYSALTLALASGGAVGGAVTMLAFWMGTLPALVVAGAAAGRLTQLRSNSRYRFVAGVLLIAGAVAAAVLSLYLGHDTHSHHAV